MRSGCVSATILVRSLYQHIGSLHSLQPERNMLYPVVCGIHLKNDGSSEYRVFIMQLVFVHLGQLLFLIVIVAQ